MIVVDASIVVELLIGAGEGTEQLRERLLKHARTIAAPHLMDAEVGQVLRRLAAKREINARRAREALVDLADLPIHRYPHTPLFDRAFELRQNTTFYDALYLALAEGLAGELWTRDRALGRIPGVRAKVRVL